MLLADDHALVCAGIRALPEGRDGILVVGEAGGGHEALRVIGKLRPHAALMDIAMASLNGLEAAGRVAKEFPDTRVFILPMHAAEDNDCVVPMLRG